MDARPGAPGTAFFGDADDDVALQRYRTLVDVIDDGLFQLDGDGRFVAVDDVLVETTGYDREELLGESLTFLLEDRDAAQIRHELVRAARSDGDVTPFDLAIQTADGRSLPHELRISPLLDDGELRGSIGIVRERSDAAVEAASGDVAKGDGSDGATEQPTGQDATAASTRDDAASSADRDGPQAPPESLSRVLEEANIGVFLLDDQFDIAWVDETTEQYFGVDRAEILGEDKRQTIQETIKHRVEDSERFADRVLATYDDNSYIEQFQCRVQPSEDDEPRWLEHYSKPIEAGPYAGGRIEFYYDVTDRKRSENALRATEARFESLIDAVEDYAIVRLDPEGRVESWNEGAEEINGYEREEVLGEHFSILYTESDRAAGVPERNLERASEAGTYETESWRVKKDGTQFWASVSLTAVQDEDGTHRGFLKVMRDVTERRERELELESELQAVLDRISDAFYAVDEELQITHVNDRAAELLQRPEEELLGEHLWDVVPEAAEIDEVSEAFETAQASQEATDVEFYYEPLGIWFEANLYPSETGISVYFQDVTERVERERALAESEQRYRTLVENFPNGAVGMFDENLEYTAAGGQVLEEVGTSQEEIVGKSIWDRYPEALAERLEPTFRAALEEGQTDEFHLQFHDRHWQAYVLPVRDGDGEIFAGMMMVQDVTDQIEHERALEESRNQLRTLIDLLPIGVFVAEPDGEIVEWNEAAEEIWGGEIAESDSVEEYDVYDGWWADSGEPVEPEEWPLARAIRGEAVIDPDEIVIEGFDGERRTVLIHGVPVRDADGDVSRAFVTMVDITERKEYQQKLESSNERLEQFAYAASHDLQEPLRMISSYLQLVQRRYGDALDEEGHEFVEFSVQAADRMRDMIEGLLEYSRVETRGNPFEPVDLNEILADVREDLQMRIEESAADLTADSLPRVEGDPVQLRQLFQNLLSNAIEYSGDEPPRIHVSAEREGEHWRLSVRDEGVGIDPEHTDRIFEVFQRLHTQEQHQGAGIGLALCRRIVERHGDELSVDSEPGEGSTFSFRLPAAE